MSEHNLSQARSESFSSGDDADGMNSTDKKGRCMSIPDSDSDEGLDNDTSATLAGRRAVPPRTEETRSVSISDSDSDEELYDVPEMPPAIPGKARMTDECVRGVAREPAPGAPTDEDVEMDADTDEDEAPSREHLFTLEKEATVESTQDLLEKEDLKCSAISATDTGSEGKKNGHGSTQCALKSGPTLRRSDRLRKPSTSVTTGVKKAPKRTRRVAKVKEGSKDGLK